MGVDAVVRALVRERLAREKPGENREPVVEPSGPLLGIGGVAESGEVVVWRLAQPDADHEAPAAQVVGRHDLLRQLPRSPASDGRDEGAEADPFSGAGLGADHHPRVHYVEVQFAPEVEVVPQEHAVPAVGFGGRREPQQLGGGTDVRETQAVAHPPTVGSAR